MLASVDAVFDALSNGQVKEHLHKCIELKASWAQDHGKKLSALANKLETGKSGWLVVGVEDSGALSKRPESWVKATEETVSQHINLYLDPSQACRGIHCREVAGSWVIAVEVTNPGAVTNWNHIAFKSAGTTICAMRPDEVLEMTLRLPGLADYSRLHWTGPVNTQNIRRFAEMVISNRKNDTAVSGLDGGRTQEILRRMRIADTNAARVLFGDCKCRIVWMDEHGNPVQNSHFNGLFPLVTPEFQERVQQWCQKAGGAKAPLYPAPALREAIANAVAHAAYFDNDGEVLLEVAPHRLTISNLCLSESVFFANKWFSGAHKSVNGLLMEALRRCGAVDELGRGKHIIFRESMLAGKQPPRVFIDHAGRNGRWRLVLYGSAQSERQVRLFSRLREAFEDERKALIAHALVLWSDQPVSKTQELVDSESLPLFMEVLEDARSPVLYYQKGDRLFVRRWVQVLLGEGKNSKKFSDAEEVDLFRLAYRIQTRFQAGVITNRDFRAVADMGDTKSEITLASAVLKRWAARGWIEKKKKGEYRFIRDELLEQKSEAEWRAALTDALRGTTDVMPRRVG